MHTSRLTTRVAPRLAPGLVSALLLLAAPVAADEPLRVLATVGMIGDVTALVGGDCVAVTTLIGGGADPHLYQPTASDVGRLQKAEVILHLGFGLEGRLGAVLDRLSDSRPVVALGPAAVPVADLIAVDSAYGVDPHLWMDPVLWSRLLPVIGGVLTEQRPACAGAIADNVRDTGATLVALDAWVRESIATIPEDLRILVTAHDAFGYFARAYGLREVAIQGLSTESEAGVADIRDVARDVAQSGVPAVFVETTINPRTVQAMIEAVAAMGREVGIGGALYSDAMGDPGTAAGTYVGMIHSNTVTITRALGGTPAPLPEALRDWAMRFGLAG